MKTDPFASFRTDSDKVGHVKTKQDINKVLDTETITGEQLVFAMRFDDTIKQRGFIAKEQAHMLAEQVRHFKGLAWQRKMDQIGISVPPRDEDVCRYCGAVWNHDTTPLPDNVKHAHDCPMSYPKNFTEPVNYDPSM